MTVYRISKRYRVLIFGFICFIIVWFASLALKLDSFNDFLGSIVNYWYLVVSILLVVAGVVFLATQHSKIVISDKAFSYTSIFGTKKLRIDEISGFEIEEKILRIHPKRPELHTPIKINGFKLFKDYDEMLDDLHELVPYLNIIEENAKRNEIANNSDFGTSKAERTSYLKKAKIVARIFNLLGIALGIAVVTRFDDFVFFGIAYIPVLLVVLFVFKGAIKVRDSEKEKVYPTVSFGVTMLAALFALKMLLSFSVYSFTILFGWSLLVGAILTVLFLKATKEKIPNGIKNMGAVALIFVLLLIYSYAAVLSANCVLDTSEDQIYTSAVLKKRISKGKTTSYNVTLEAWGRLVEPKETNIGKDKYDALEIGDVVNVTLHQGALGVPWYEVEK